MTQLKENCYRCPYEIHVRVDPPRGLDFDGKKRDRM